MASTEQLQARLDEAEEAYHALVTGQSVVTVSSTSGKSVTYTADPKNLGALAAYIAQLKRQLGQSNNRPLRPIIG